MLALLGSLYLYGDRHQKYWLASFLDIRVIQGYSGLEVCLTLLTLDNPE